MNRQEQQFDELMRHKLADYSEPPDMPMLDNIHTKKNRILKWYGLYRILVLASAIGLGLWGSIEAGKLISSQQQANTATPAATHADQQIRDAESMSIQAQDKNNLPYTGNSSANQHNTLSGGHNHSVYSGSNSTPSVTSGADKETNSVNNAANGVSATPAKAKTSSPAKKGDQPAERMQDIDTKSSDKGSPSNNESSENKKDNKTEETTSCNAAFDYYVSYNGEVNFNNFSELSTHTEIKWSFGDGETSRSKEPVHFYEKGGSYDVTLIVKNTKSGCEHSISKRVTIGLPVEKQLLRLKGMVKSGGTGTKEAIVELMQFDRTKNGYEILSTIKANQSGMFEFAGIKEGKYLLKAYPVLNGDGYMPTFWGNTASSDEAGEIVAFDGDQDLIGYNIDLLYNPLAKIEQPSNLLEQNRKTILLFDQNNQLVASITADANGNFNFGGLKAGNYTAVDPETGKSGSVDAGANGNTSGNASTLGGSGSVAVSGKISLSPNPAKDMVNFGVEAATEETATIIIVNANGVEIYKTQQKLNGGFNQSQLDVSGLAPGVYYVMVIRGNNKIVTSRLVKQFDSTK